MHELVLLYTGLPWQHCLCLHRSGNGRLTLREMRRTDLMEALELLDTEEDINRVRAVCRLEQGSE